MQEAVETQGLTGIVNETVMIGDQLVQVGGNVIDGVFHMGTMTPLP
jgi:hypothetical protein